MSPETTLPPEIELAPGWLDRAINSPEVRAIGRLIDRERAIKAIYDEFRGNAHMMAIAIYEMRRANG